VKLRWWFLIAGTCLLAALTSPDARAHWNPGLHNQQHAVVWAFCNGKSNLSRICEDGQEALKVAEYESGEKHWFGGTCRWANNGQYLGCFQMGESERKKYGHSKVWPYHGNNAWTQAKAAWRYYVATKKTWSPWECKPWGCGW
jgi:hypothetical protein